ncbi:hypothetical protein ACFL2C_00005, partial [Patescibacteria group bacterium]
ATIFGKNEVVFLDEHDKAIKKGKINVIPLGTLDKVRIKCDLFISTWALSESSKHSHKYVVSRKWFGARRVFLAYQESNNNFPHASDLGEYVRKKDGVVQKIRHTNNSCYGYFLNS